MLVKCHLLAFVREVSIYRNQELDSVVQYARIETCDESIGSLEPFALRRSTFNCNAGADLEQLCEPAVLTERVPRILIFGSGFFNTLKDTKLFLKLL